MNFIIYEDEVRFRDIYKKVIMKLMGHNNFYYNIIEFKSFNDKLHQELQKIENNKIYILDIEVEGKTGIELAREIRKLGDDIWACYKDGVVTVIKTEQGD